MPDFVASDIVNDSDLESSKSLISNLKPQEYRRKDPSIDLDLDNIKSFKQVMRDRALDKEEQRLQFVAQKKPIPPRALPATPDESKPNKRKKRWDVTPEEYEERLKLVKANVVLPEMPVVNGIRLDDDILERILPKGYVKVDPPADYKPMDPERPPDAVSSHMYQPPSASDALIDSSLANVRHPSDIPGVTGLEYFKQHDTKYFGKLVTGPAPDQLTGPEKTEVLVMQLLLKIKNGNQITRKRAMRAMTGSARKFGPKVLLAQILPILLDSATDEQERHVLVKLLGRILFQIDSAIRPYTSKVVAVVSPLLIDEDVHVRVEAREIITSLTKAAGFANMVATLRPDIDHVDEYVRNIASRVFAIVAVTLGLTNFLPFLKAVLKSKRWTAKHTGIRIIQQMCVNLGSGNGSSLLPFLDDLVSALEPCLRDETPQVRITAALALAQMAESVAPYGAELFEGVLEPVCLGMRKHRGKGLASFLKCLGAIIPLMNHNPYYEEYANYYTKEIIHVLSREFDSPDDDMRKTVLRILVALPLSKQLVPEYHQRILGPLMKAFWNRRTAADLAQITRLVVLATTQVAKKFDLELVLKAVTIFSKDANEKLRRMLVDALHRMLVACSQELVGVDSDTEVKLIDGILYAFQEQTQHERVYLVALGALASALGLRLRPHMDSIISTVLFRLKNKTPEVREQAADLIVVLAPLIQKCYGGGDDSILQKLILVLYESLGEVSPLVLGSIINGLYACIDSMDRSSLAVLLNPSVNQLVPALTPILKNRQEKVQEACVRLTGLIARKHAETINAKEWMRICFELLEMLKSPRKRIRVAANDTFGHIAKTIGPQDVIVMLLNNLRVQERQLRVCTAVAIGIVAEVCAPFTVLPAIMNEYRIPEKNVQNGVLKAVSFLFEYLDGAVASDYLYATVPLITHALTDRDQVHRQTAATVVQHLALNCMGVAHGRYHDVFVHFLNLMLPNVFETSPHVIERILDSLAALRNVLGVGIFCNYIWAGMFHPARIVRSLYWKMFNSAYIQSSDLLVPFYPTFSKVDGDSGPINTVPELDVYI